jgi:hypothetical protein
MEHSDPDTEAWNLSDSDDNLFDTPAPLSKDKSAATAAAKSNTGANGKPTEKPTRYDTEEAGKARDEQLKIELENVRRINQVIEGVVESLEKAKANMNVCTGLIIRNPHHTNQSVQTDRIPYCNLCINPPPNLDAHPLPDRAQPTSNLESNMARCESRSSLHRAGGSTTTSRYAETTG